MTKNHTCFIVAFFLLTRLTSEEVKNPLKNISIKNNFSLSLEQEEIEKSTWSDTVDFSILLNGFSVKTAWKLPATEFKNEPELNPPVWGFEINAKKFINFPLSLKAGQLSCSGSASKFSSPGISNSISPLGSVSKTITGLNSNFPTASGYEKPFAVFSEIKLQNARNLIPLPKAIQKLEFASFFNTEELFLFSTNFSMKLPRKNTFSFAYTTGRFLISSSNSSWISDFVYFPETWYFFHSLQGSFNAKHFYSKFSLNIFQSAINPEKQNIYTFSCENSLSYRYFTLNFSAFSASSREIFNSNGKHLPTMAQFKLNPQFTIFLPNNFAKLRTGIFLLAEEKLDGESTLVQSKTGILEEFLTKSSCTKLQFSISDIKLGESFYDILHEDIPFSKSEAFESSNLELSVYHAFVTNYSPSLKLAYSYSKENKKNTYKATLKLNFNKLSASSSFYLNSKDGEIKTSRAELKASYKIAQKKLLVTAAFGIKYDFL